MGIGQGKVEKKFDLKETFAAKKKLNDEQVAKDEAAAKEKK